MNELRRLRLIQDISQAELARRSGVSPIHISAFERQVVQPWPKARASLARALGVTPGTIWPELEGVSTGETP